MLAQPVARSAKLWRSRALDMWARFRACASAGPRERLRARAWWAQFRVSGGHGGRLSRGTIVDQGIDDRTHNSEVREVQSAEALIAGGSRPSRLWRARPSQPVGRNLALLEDLCTEGADHWRPWEAAAEPYESAPLSYRRFSDALLFVRSGIVMPEPYVALRESRPPWADLLKRLPGGSRVAAQAPTLRLGAARPRRVIDGPALSLCHVYGRGYGHWISDALPPLIDVLDLVAAQRLPILTRPLLPWQRRTLVRLGVPDAAIVEIGDATVACIDLVCHSFGGKEHALRPGPLMDAVYRRLRSTSQPDADGPRPRLIYASRRALGSWRDFANEAEIEAALAPLGFVVMSPENMTLDEQIAAFSRAEVIVGPHGSALANAGFAPPGCLIVSIVPDQIPHRWIYGLAGQLGHRLVVLIAPREGSERVTPFFTPFRYRLAPEIVIQRTLAAMELLGIQSGSAS